ncbi:hypothetical protein [Streptomyces sp. NPDC056817]|uniref:hypothetical protein n=1 Tax=Streptomyces sp. NPDC056817 TaxID=3345950 RepID=UPI0036739194
MSLTDLRARAKHRKKSRSELVQKIGQLEREADESTCRIVALASEIDDLTTANDELTAERNRLEAQLRRQAVQAGEVIRQLEKVVRLRDRQIDDLQRKVTIGVRAEHVIAKTQELDPEEIRKHCTQTRVMTLQQAHCIGPVTDPGRTHPAWARTQPDPAP